MNRVLSRTSKLSKIIGKANFFTKINKPLNLIGLRISSGLNNTSKMTFIENERRFEKLSDSSTGGIRQGKHNIRSNFTTEKLVVVLDYIEKNAQSFNDGDYLDSMYILAQKFDQDSNKINMKKPPIKLINDYVIANFQKNSGSMSNIYLSYLSALSARNVRLFSGEILKNFISKNITFLEKNHANTPLYPLINSISMIGLLTNMNPLIYIKGREDEICGLNVAQLLRIAKRIANPSQSNLVRSVLVKFIINELINKALSDRILIKARVLNVLCRIDHVDYSLNLSQKIRSLVKTISNEMDQLDSVAILPIVEAMIYWDDFSKGDFLREINDLVSTTITHSADSIYPDFFIRYLEFHSRIKGNLGLTNDHLKIFFDFYLKNRKPEDIRYPRSLICFFLVMRNCKFYEKEYIEQFFDITLKHIPFERIDDNLIAYKYLVNIHLNDDLNEKLRQVISAEVPKMIEDNFNRNNSFNILSNFTKLCFFNCPSEVIENAFNKVKSSLETVEPRLIQGVLENYVNNCQDHIKGQYRDIIASLILNKIDPKDENKSLTRIYIYINELFIARENEELKNKVRSYSETLSENPMFKNGLIRTFELLTKENIAICPITNMSFVRYISLLKELIKDPSFIEGKENYIILNILQTTSNIIKINKEEEKISDDLLTIFLRIGNDIISRYPNTLVALNVTKLANFIKSFNSKELESPLVEKLAMKSLDAIPDERLERELNMDLIIILDKLSKGGKSQEKIELVKKILGSEEKLNSILSHPYVSIQTFKLLANFNKMDTSIVPNSLIEYGKELLMKRLKDENINTFNKLNIIFALSLPNPRFFNEIETKELGIDIHNVFIEFPLNKLINNLSNAPININKGTISKLIHIKYSNLYEKEENPSKKLAIKTLDRFTFIRWPNISMFNKLISDYGNLFDKFTSSEHAYVINCFSRMNIAREDMIKTACTAINTGKMIESDKFNLFKSLIKLGYYKGESKVPIFDTLFNQIDFTNIIKRQNVINKFQLFFYGWKLSQSEYDTKAFMDIILENIIKFYNEKSFEIKKRFNWDNITYFLLISEYSQNFDENTKKFLKDLFEQRKTMISSKYYMKILINYLKEMKNTIEEFPESNLVDIYLPENKIGVVFLDTPCINIFDKTPNDDYMFISEELKKKDITPVLITSGDVIKHFRESNKNHREFIEILEKTFGFPNKNVEGNYDFSSLENNLEIKNDNVDEE